ncbi:serine/threonine protein kinase [Chthoniobacter flavus]|nr:serine/threonine protein kinase [Chthoniobacter flavus]
MSDLPTVMPDPQLNDADATPEQIQAEIFVYVGQELKAKYAIEHGEYIIGRDASCPIRIDADLVSRHHARLTFNAYELVIEDLGSSNGVFIDSIQVQLPTRVRLDQEVQVGTARLFIRLRAEAAKQLAEALWDKDLGLAQVREQLEEKKYKVITTINRGGMGVILQARDLRIRRTVAMKVMKTSNQFSRENVLRFIDEAQLTGQLEHPNIVPIYELGIDDQGEIFYTMKFVKGTTLDDVLRGIRNGRQKTIEKYPLGTLLTIFQKVCDAVAYAHSKSIVHRDLKPENIMIGSFGEVLVMDWGLAKNLTTVRKETPEHPQEPVPDTPVAKSGDNLRGFETMHGLIVGTPPYISPEQARGELDRIDERSDIYVLGGILYAILALRPPVEGESVHEVVEKIVTSAIAPPSSYNQPARKSAAKTAGENSSDGAPANFVFAHCPNKRIPDGLSAVVMKALALDPADRYQHVEDLQTDIEAYQGGFATKAERASVAKHALLFAARHKKEVALFLVFAVIFNVVVIGFFLQLMHERDRARLSEKRAIDQEQLAAARLNELRGTAPTFASDAQQLIDENRFPEALEKIEYAIQQVPNEATYHNLRGNILQAQLRLEEAADAYTEALRLNPKLKEAQVNLDLSRRVLKSIGTDEQIKPAIQDELYKALMNQGRHSAAESIRDEFGMDKQRLNKIWRDTFDKHGLRAQRFETNGDGTVSVDFSYVAQPDFKKLRDLPVTGLILDETRITDLNALKGMELESLSLGHTVVRDLSPLEGMPLRNLSLEGSAVLDLRPLHDLPLEVLRLSTTRVANLVPLKGMPIEQLYLANCRSIKDISALDGMPLQTLTLNHTSITDLKPLIHSPLRELNLEGCTSLTDLRPLMEIATLESVLIPLQCKDIAFLRNHPGIKRLSYIKMTEPAEEFWKAFDTRAAGHSTPKQSARPVLLKAEVTPAAKEKEKPAEKVTEKTAEKAADKTPDKAPEKPTNKAAEKPVEKATEKPSDKTPEKAPEPPDKKPAPSAAK